MIYAIQKIATLLLVLPWALDFYAGSRKSIRVLLIVAVSVIAVLAVMRAVRSVGA